MKKIFFIAGLITGSLCFAQNGVTLGTPDFRGNGCNRGTATSSVSADGQTISILFDNYIAEAGGNLRERKDRKHCNVSIPVVVPQGHSFAVFKVDFRGFNYLPAGAQSQFTADYFFRGRLGPRYVQNFRGPLENNFVTNNNLTVDNIIWSPCRERTFELRTHTTMSVETNQQREQVLGMVDSADLQAGLVYHLVWKTCNRNDR